MKTKRTTILGLILLSMGYHPLLNAQNEKGWDYQFELYGLLATIDGDASIGRIEGAPVDADFGTILENLEMGAMAHFEAFRDNQWGIIMDYGFMRLGTDLSGPSGGLADITMRQGTLEVMGAYHMKQGKSTYDFYGGIRWV